MGAWTLLFVCLIVIFFSYTVFGLLIKKDYRALSELVKGIIFGFLLEFMNVFLTKSYTYNPQFVLQLGQVPNNIPISIALAWELIMMNSHHIIQRYNLPPIAETF